MSVTADADLEFGIVILPDEPLVDVIVEQLAAARPGRALSVHSSLTEAAAAQGERALLLVLADPVEALARGLQVSGSAGVALAGWKAAAAPVLAAARKLRKRIWLVDARAVASGDPATLGLIRSGGSGPKNRSVPSLPDPIYMVVAEALLARDAEASRFAGEIAALRRGGGGASVDLPLCEAALGRYTGLLKEADLMRSQISLSASMHDREDTNVAAKAEAAELATKVAALEVVEAERTLHKVKAEALQRKLDDLQLRTTQRDSILGGVLLADQAQDRIDQERRRADALEQELQRVYASRSWRITGPLRAVRSRV